MEKLIIKTLNEILQRDCGSVNENDDLVDYGLDSMKAVELVVELENEYDIEVDDEDLLIENLNTISKINTLIKKYKDEF